MDYGYLVLRHVVQQVFGNIGAAARITIVPIMLAYVISGLILYGLLGQTFFDLIEQQRAGVLAPQPFDTDQNAIAFVGRMFLGFILCIPVFLVFYAWAAVGWHRFVLLEERPGGVTARWNGSMIKSYVWAIIRLSLMLMLIGFVAAIVIGIVAAILPSPAVLVFLTVGLTIGFTWATTRLGLVLPSAAVGNYMKLGDSWSATAAISGAIILPIIVIPLLFFIINTALGFLGFIGGLLTLLTIWLQTLMNLALLTTLYGNLIEGRQLN